MSIVARIICICYHISNIWTLHLTYEFYLLTTFENIFKASILFLLALFALSLSRQGYYAHLDLWDCILEGDECFISKKFITQ